LARNVEIKARVTDWDALVERVAAIGGDGPTLIQQDDTFFNCSAGRLKLRTFADGRGELIFYRRANAPGPKESQYVRSPTDSPHTLREALTQAYGVAGRVRKQRTLFMIGRTRVHLDRVEGLGDFVELEVVLADGELAEAGIDEAHDLMHKLRIEPAQLIDTAYVTLALRGNRP